jgi:hypothetical protein
MDVGVGFCLEERMRVEGIWKRRDGMDCLRPGSHENG